MALLELIAKTLAMNSLVTWLGSTFRGVPDCSSWCSNLPDEVRGGCCHELAIRRRVCLRLIVFKQLVLYSWNIHSVQLETGPSRISYKNKKSSYSETEGVKKWDRSTSHRYEIINEIHETESSLKLIVTHLVTKLISFISDNQTEYERRLQTFYFTRIQLPLSTINFHVASETCIQ